MNYYKNLLLDLSVFVKNFENKKFKVVNKTNIFNSEFLFLYYFSLYNKFNNPIRSILINYFIKCEKLYPGSSFLFSKLILNKNKYDNLKKIKCNKNNIKAYFLQKTKKEYVDFFLEVLDFSGPDSSINCNSNKNSEFLIEKKLDSYFDIKIHDDFKNIYFKNIESKKNNFLFFIVDGFIEKESEINYAIEECINKKLNCVFISRGISKSVSSFIKNLALKKIYIYPYVSKFENNDPFLFEDIANSLGSTIINSSYNSINTGIKDNIIQTNDNLEIKKNKISIKKENKELLNQINNQLKDVNDEKLKEYLLKRKNRINSNTTFVLIPEDKSDYLQEIKSIIFCYNEILKFGLVSSGEKIYSLKEIEISKKLSISFAKNTNKIGYVIKNEK